MKMIDLTENKYPLKLESKEAIEILKEQDKKRLDDNNLDCNTCLFSSCIHSLNPICIEHECLEQTISILEETTDLCINNKLIDENHRANKVYKS